MEILAKVGIVFSAKVDVEALGCKVKEFSGSSNRYRGNKGIGLIRMRYRCRCSALSFNGGYRQGGGELKPIWARRRRRLLLEFLVRS